jgi:hypothetical protein
VPALEVPAPGGAAAAPAAWPLHAGGRCQRASSAASAGGRQGVAAGDGWQEAASVGLGGRQARARSGAVPGDAAGRGGPSVRPRDGRHTRAPLGCGPHVLWMARGACVMMRMMQARATHTGAGSPPARPLRLRSRADERPAGRRGGSRLPLPAGRLGLPAGQLAAAHAACKRGLMRATAAAAAEQPQQPQQPRRQPGCCSLRPPPCSPPGCQSAAPPCPALRRRMGEGNGPFYPL